MKQQVPLCPSCQGVVKPDITFFGEKLPAKVKRAVEADHKKASNVVHNVSLLYVDLSVGPAVSGLLIVAVAILRSFHYGGVGGGQSVGSTTLSKS